MYENFRLKISLAYMFWVYAANFCRILTTEIL